MENNNFDCAEIFSDQAPTLYEKLTTHVFTHI